MGIIDETMTIAEKEVQLELRYKLPFLLGSFIDPLVRIIPFLLVYAGFFSMSSGEELGQFISEETFIPFLLLGITIDMFFYAGYKSFSGKFLTEKYWETINIILLAPINKLSLITGFGLSDLVGMIPSTIFFIGAAYIFYPIPIPNFLLVFFIILVMFLIALSLGLIVGSSSLFNEGLAPFFGYFRVGLVFISCFYYPIEVLSLRQLGVLDFILPALAKINPFYQANFVIKSLWFEGAAPLNSMIYVLFFAVVSPIAAVYIFEKLWQHLGIQGY